MAPIRCPTALAAAMLLLPAAMAATLRPLIPNAESQGEAVMAWCASEERACWARGELWASGACHAPLEQGPCPDAHWLLLDAHAMPRGTCAPRPCPPAQLPSAGRCLEEAEAREMCWSGAVHLDALGRLRCGASPGWTAILKAHVRCQQPTAQPSDYNSTADDGYNNANDDGYNNATDDGYNNADYSIDNFIDSDFNSTASYATAPDYITNARNDSNSDGYPITNPSLDDNSAMFNSTHTNIAGQGVSVDSKLWESPNMFGAAAGGPSPLRCARGQGGECAPSVVESAGVAARSCWALVPVLLCGRHLTGVSRW